MARIKLPYTMYCVKCKAALKIKKAELIGTRINCPKCHKKIDVVTPEEDGYVPYGVEAAPEPEPEPEPTEEEIEAKEEEERKVRRAATWKQFKYWMSVLWLLMWLGLMSWLLYYFIWVRGYSKRKDEEKKPYQEPAWIMPRPDAPQANCAFA